MLPSLQNGVEIAAIIARHVAWPVVPAVVDGATAMAGPGRVAHFGRGDLVIGPMNAQAAADPVLAAALQRVADVLAAAGVPVEVSAEVMT